MASHRHKRETARRKPRAALIAGPLAVLATGAAVSAGVLGAETPSTVLAVDQTSPAGSVGDAMNRLPALSRGDGDRTAAAPEQKEKKPQPPSPVEKILDEQAVAAAIEQADTRLWTTAALNLWTRPDDRAAQVGVMDEGERVLVTGRELAGRHEIVVDGRALWVTSGYFSEEQPFALGGDCTNGTSVPSAVSENIKKVHEAVCANFPEITSYGTFRSDGEHSQGIAIDIMVSGARGWEVAEFVREHYADLGVSYLIYSQRIWSVERSSEGWRPMEDRGSTTANHYDHVHVTTY